MHLSLNYSKIYLKYIDFRENRALLYWRSWAKTLSFLSVFNSVIEAHNLRMTKGTKELVLLCALTQSTFWIYWLSSHGSTLTDINRCWNAIYSLMSVVLTILYRVAFRLIILFYQLSTRHRKVARIFFLHLSWQRLPLFVSYLMLFCTYWVLKALRYWSSLSRV